MKMSRSFLAVLILFVPLSCNGSQNNDPQTLAIIDELKQELSVTKTAIEEAAKQDALYSGGLVKSLIAVRLEILRTNEALIQQRIHALESGVPIKIEVIGSAPDLQKATQLEQEIQTKRAELADVKKEMERYSGGLVLAMKTSTATTIENTIAMLDQERLFAKYGFSYKLGSNAGKNTPPVQPPSMNKSTTPAEEIISLVITNKRVQKADYNENIWFDIEWKPIKLKKPARSIKGIIHFCDLFGEPRFQIRKTINDPIGTESSLVEKGVGFEYNQFKSEHVWLRQTDLKDMTFKFIVESILYADGEREDY